MQLKELKKIRNNIKGLIGSQSRPAFGDYVVVEKKWIEKLQKSLDELNIVLMS